MTVIYICILSTSLGDRYVYMTGMSMAGNSKTDTVADTGS